jgi:hypothetical protein
MVEREMMFGVVLDFHFHLQTVKVGFFDGASFSQVLL